MSREEVIQFFSNLIPSKSYTGRISVRQTGKEHQHT